MRISITTLQMLHLFGDKTASKTVDNWLAMVHKDPPALVKAFWTEEKNNFSLIVQENKNAEA